MNRRSLIGSLSLSLLVACSGDEASAPTSPPPVATLREIAVLDAGPSPGLLATGDIDGDGRADLVVANTLEGGASGVTVLLAAQGFAASEVYPVGEKAITRLVVGDVDGDGREDVLAVDDLVQLKSEPGGTLAPAEAMPAAEGETFVDVIVGFFTKIFSSSEAREVATVSKKEGAYVFRDPSGTATEFPDDEEGPGTSTDEGTQEPSGGDMDGDGYDDFATATADKILNELSQELYDRVKLKRRQNLAGGGFGDLSLVSIGTKLDDKPLFLTLFGCAPPAPLVAYVGTRGDETIIGVPSALGPWPYNGDQELAAVELALPKATVSAALLGQIDDQPGCDGVVIFEGGAYQVFSVPPTLPVKVVPGIAGTLGGVTKPVDAELFALDGTPTLGVTDGEKLHLYQFRHEDLVGTGSGGASTSSTTASSSSTGTGGAGGGENCDTSLLPDLLVTGTQHSCVRTCSGCTKCWGQAGHGELGEGLGLPQTSLVEDPSYAPSFTEAVDMAVGVYSTCIVNLSGKVQCVGDNAVGSLGDGTTTASTKLVDAKAISAPVKKIAAAGGTACALTTGGDLWCWGANDAGQVGTGATNAQPIPTPAKVLSGVVDFDVAAQHTCAVTGAIGAVQCWGGYNMALGRKLAKIEDSAKPGKVVLDVNAMATVDLLGAARVSVGAASCALMSDKQVRCWSPPSFGVFGDDAPDNTTIGKVATIAALSSVAELEGQCARTELPDASVYCWGAGPLGNGTSFETTDKPVKVMGANSSPIDGFTKLSGNGQVCGLIDDASMWCWGPEHGVKTNVFATIRQTGCN